MFDVSCSDPATYAHRSAGLISVALVGAAVAAMGLSSPSRALDMAEEPFPSQAPSSSAPEAPSLESLALTTETDPAAQTGEGIRHRFGYGLMVAHDQARDDLLIPLRWSGPSVGLRLQWDLAAASSRHSVKALIPASFYENRFGHDGYGLGIEIAYSYMRDARKDFHHGRLFFGGQVKWDVHHGYYESWDEEHIYWFGAYSLGPRFTWNRQRGNNTHFAAELDVPLIALVSRPPLERLNKADSRTKPSFYFTAPNRDIAFAGPLDYTALHGGVSVARRWGKSSIVFAYDLELATYDEPARVVTLSNRFSILRTGW